MNQYNGSLSLTTNQLIIRCISMPHLMGHVFGPLVYALRLGHQFQHLHITQLEMLNVVGPNFGLTKRSKYSVIIRL